MHYRVRIVAVLLLVGMQVVAQNTNGKTSVNEKLPIKIFGQFIEATDKFELNDANAFKHVDLPKSYYNTFLSFIKDSSVAEISGLKSLVYYRITLKDGNFFNGDVYWNNQSSYIVFKVDGNKYVNYFAPEGVAQIKNIFKF